MISQFPLTTMSEKLEQLQGIMGEAPGARQTAAKTLSLVKRGTIQGGYSITGFVLSTKAGDRCIIEMGASRWLSDAEMWWFMHDSAQWDQPPIHSVCNAPVEAPNA